MAIIKSIIPTSNFELIGNRIGEILAEEFSYQYTLSSPPNEDINPKIFVERFITIDLTEMPAINICLSNGNYDNKDITQVDGNYTFNIDCYANAESTSEQQGDTLATIKLHRILAMVRAILENPGYNTLGYDKPFLCSCKVLSINVADPIRVNDATHKIQGRLEFNVRVPEYVSLLTAIPISANDTVVKLYLTEKGYQWGMAGQIAFIVPEFTEPPYPIDYFIAENLNEDEMALIKFSQLGQAPDIGAIDYFVGVRDDGAGNKTNYKYTASELIAYVGNNNRKRIVSTVDSKSITDVFFSTHTISEISTQQQSYISDIDFTQSGDTITGITIFFFNGQVLIAKV